jgi:hypothetical protein
MEKAFAKAEELADTLGEYINTRIRSVKLEAAEKSSVVMADVLSGMIVAVGFIFFIGLGSIALSYGIGEWIGEIWAGFLIVACIYLVTGILVWIMREKLFRIPITNELIRQLFRNEDEEDQNH